MYDEVSKEVTNLENVKDGSVVDLPPDVAALQTENLKLEYRIKILKRVSIYLKMYFI